MITRSINVNNENISYLDSSAGTTTLLFLHGAFINKEYWAKQFDYFSKEYRVIAVDLAGHGSSSHRRNNYAINTFADDVRALIKILDLKNMILVGHSFGTAVALEIVAKDFSRIIGIVEVDHLKNVGNELPETVIEGIIKGLRTDFAATCRQFAHQALISEATDPELVNRLFADYAQTDHEVGIAIFQNAVGYTEREVNLLKNLPIKLHLIHVDYTPTDKSKLREHLGKNHELNVIKGTCHYPMIENPVRFNVLLAEIIRKIVSG